MGGHSRGAAVTNLLAQKILKLKSDWKGHVPEIFAYGFATPNVVQKGKVVETKRIINFLHEGDIVPEVPLNREGWDYTKAGRIFEFSVNATAKKLFKEYTGGKKTLKWLSASKKEDFIDFLDDLCKHSRKNYDKKIAGSDYTIEDFCRYILGYKIADLTREKEDIISMLIEMRSTFPDIKVPKDLLGKAVAHTFLGKLANSHHMETYLASIYAMKKW